MKKTIEITREGLAEFRFAKCISTQCEKYDSCIRAHVNPTSEVNYGALCFEGDERWYAPFVIVEEDELDENKSEK